MKRSYRKVRNVLLYGAVFSAVFSLTSFFGNVVAGFTTKGGISVTPPFGTPRALADVPGGDSLPPTDGGDANDSCDTAGDTDCDT